MPQDSEREWHCLGGDSNTKHSNYGVGYQNTVSSIESLAVRDKSALLVSFLFHKRKLYYCKKLNQFNYGPEV